MNELPVIGSLFYAQRVLGSPRDKQRKLLQRKYTTKSCLGVQKTVFGELSTVFQPFYQKRIKAMLIRGQCKFLS